MWINGGDEQKNEDFSAQMHARSMHHIAACIYCMVHFHDFRRLIKKKAKHLSYGLLTPHYFYTVRWMSAGMEVKCGSAPVVSAQQLQCVCSWSETYTVRFHALVHLLKIFKRCTNKLNSQHILRVLLVFARSSWQRKQQKSGPSSVSVSLRNYLGVISNAFLNGDITLARSHRGTLSNGAM